MQFAAQKVIPATLIAGDGIGPEIVDATVMVLDALGAPFAWEAHKAGMSGMEEFGDPLPQSTLDSIRRTRLALKGPLTTPIGGGYRSSNVRLREEFQLYANVRPARTLVPGGRYEDIDVVLVRENIEGLYVGFEHYIPIGDDPRAVAIGSGVNTRAGCGRIAEFAFDYAVRNGRKKVTIVHKANILKLGDGLFLECVRRVSREYPDISYDEKIIDAACMHLVLNPLQFDVLVMPNLYGDIVSDLCAGLVGGLGVVGAANLGSDIGVFEAVHGSAPDIAGKNVANPTALLLSAVMMLRHLDEGDAADRIVSALEHVLTEGKIRTRDVGGVASTSEFTDALCRALE